MNFPVRGYAVPSVQTTNDQVRSTVLATLQHDMTQEEVAGLLGNFGKHQFTAILSNGTVQCVQYTRDEMYGRYFIVFLDGKLKSICHPPLGRTREERRIANGGSWSVSRVFEAPEKHIQEILDAPDLTGENLKTEMKVLPKERSSHIDFGLTAVAATTQVVSPLFSNPFSARRRRNEWMHLLEKYNPFSFDVGMSREQIEARLGESHLVEELGNGNEFRLYGAGAYTQPGGEREFVWIGFVFEAGKTIRIFSRDFLDFDRVTLLGLR